MGTFIKPYRTGDVVQFVGKSPFWNKRKRFHIIDEVRVNDVNDYEYSTDRGAWFNHSDFQLIRECDESSIRNLVLARHDE